MNATDGRFILSGIISLISLIFAGPVYAACSMPGGAPDAVAGDVAYNVDETVMQYCNGTNWISMGGGGSLPVCSAGQILQYDDPNDEWDCVSTGGAGAVLFSNGTTLATDSSNLFWDDTNNRLGIGTAAPDYRLTIGAETDQWSASLAIQPSGHATSERAAMIFDNWIIGQDMSGNGTKDFFFYDSDDAAVRLGISASGVISGNGSGLTNLNETDPQVGTLTASKWCTTNGTVIDCTTNAPITSESDPQVGTLTNTKWCTTDGTTINCTSDAPGGGSNCSSASKTFTVTYCDNGTSTQSRSCPAADHGEVVYCSGGTWMGTYAQCYNGSFQNVSVGHYNSCGY